MNVRMVGTNRYIHLSLSMAYSIPAKHYDNVLNSCEIGKAYIYSSNTQQLAHEQNAILIGTAMYIQFIIYLCQELCQFLRP